MSESLLLLGPRPVQCGFFGMPLAFVSRGYTQAAMRNGRPCETEAFVQLPRWAGLRVPELCLAGHRGGSAHLRGTALSRCRGVVRPERAAGRGRLGPVDSQADQDLRFVRSDRFEAYARKSGRVLPAGVEAGRRSIASDHGQ